MRRRNTIMIVTKTNKNDENETNTNSMVSNEYQKKCLKSSKINGFKRLIICNVTNERSERCNDFIPDVLYFPFGKNALK